MSAVRRVYEASQTNLRHRATRDEMVERAAFLIAYASQHGPVTVRQLYYRAEVCGIPGIDKTDAGYDKVQRQVLELRRAGRLPYTDIADLTRWMRKPDTYDGVEAALQETARLYRKALWADADTYIEIWCEKDALAGVIYPVTAEYDVPLMVSRGYASETFCFEAIAARESDPRTYDVWYLGDFDRSGCDAAQSLKEKLERFAAERGVRVHFHQLAIEQADVRRFSAEDMTALVNLNGELKWLPAREHKRKSPADKAWPHAYAIELDAIEPDDLRRMIREIITSYLPPEQLKILRVAEKSERQLLGDLVNRIARAKDD
jgi:hypothetical protein